MRSGRDASVCAYKPTVWTVPGVGEVAEGLGVGGAEAREAQDCGEGSQWFMGRKMDRATGHLHVRETAG